MMMSKAAEFDTEKLQTQILNTDNILDADLSRKTCTWQCTYVHFQLSPFATL